MHNVKPLAPPAIHYALPGWREVAQIVAVAVEVALLLSSLVWIASLGFWSTAGFIGGVITGALVVLAWVLSDWHRRISFALAITCVGLLAALWLRGSEAGATGTLTSCAVLLTWLLFLVVMTVIVNRETMSPIRTVGSGDHGRALLVYHSAHGGFMRAMQEAVAAGIQAEGWRGDLVTASRAAPKDLSPYQLLILGAPCYNRNPARPILNYLARVGSLRGIPVVIVVSGFNRTEEAMRILHDHVAALDGRILDEIEIWTSRPNPVHNGTRTPEEIMRHAGIRAARLVKPLAA